MVEIIVIGPKPPCIRCLTAFKRANEVAKQFSGKVEVRMLHTHEEEARKYGRIEGGHVIAQAEKVDHNHERIEALRKQIEGPDAKIKDAELVETAMNELEKELAPVKEKARERGYLMTPVVVVNGQIKVAGDVPKKEEIQQWIEKALNE